MYWGTELVSPFWFLSAPAGGVSIAQDGTITVAQDAELAEANNVVIKAAFRGKTYTRMFTLTKARDGESPITLDLLPDNEVIQCDYLGNPLRGLPLTAKATLYRGTREITAAMELAEAARVEIIRYPGNIFDPAPGDFYPTLGYPVVWTLIGAPAGVTIDKYGLITAPLTAQLNDVNKITVRAAYHGRTYEAIFGITKARGGRPADPPAYLVYRYAKNTNPAAPPAYAANADNPGAGWSERPPSPGNGEHLWQLTSEWRGLIRLTGWTALCLNGEKGDAAVAARYRGATKTADTGNTGVVNIVGKPSSVMNPGDWVMFTGSSGWEYAYVYEWNGALWRQVPRGEMAYYLDGISDLTEGAPDGIFSAVFCRILFAQQAAINTLEAQLIRIGGAIFGGERFTRSGDSVVDNGANKTGFKIGADGLLEASGGIFNNILVTGNSEFRGKIISGPLYASNEDTAAKTHHVFEANTGIGSIWQALGPGKAAYYADGQYGGRTGITSLILSRATGDIPGGGGAVGVYTMFIAFEDDAFDYLTDKITQRLDVYIHGDTGKTLRFIDLPVGGGSAIGDVYRYGEGRLYVTKEDD